MLKGKNAIITGCSRGIGKATVECFAKNGADIWACARCETPEFIAYCEECSAKYDVHIEPIFFDMTDDDSMKRAIQKIHSEKRSVDILVNNAGFSTKNNTIFQMTKFEDIDYVMNVNFTATMKLTQQVLKFMIRQKGGSIINVSSVAALCGQPGQLAYAASKGALLSATSTLASEYGASGIRCNAVAPGVIKTDMIDFISPDYIERLKSESMLGRMGNPEEIANVIAFLGSDMSSYMTGQVLLVNGGLKI